MKKILITFMVLLPVLPGLAQTNPAITNWILNTSGTTGSHYLAGSSTPVSDTAQVNVQRVRYSTDYSYINCSGFPAYVVGPYLDGNPALATNNNWLFKIPLDTMENTGALTSTPMGAIGIFINGVPMYNYADGASYQSSSGGDAMMGGDGVWNRNAIMAENDGFDCAKGHPSPIFAGPPGPGGTLLGGAYHHHQNPTAFNLDLFEVSDVCDLYLADGLYTLDSTTHSPLIGFAFDGYPIYGAYGYDAGGAVKRIEPSYQKRSITVRTHLADGTDVTDGPAVSTSYPLGWYKEDYEYIPGSGDLDEHNGRWCITPEYPSGTYAYFATVDENWNSAYPYIIGDEYYGVVETSNFTGPGGSTSVTVTEPTTDYTPVITVGESLDNLKITIFPNPGTEFIAVQVGNYMPEDLKLQLFDLGGKLVREANLNRGSTISHVDTRTLYNGQYLLNISNERETIVKNVMILRE